MPVIKLNDLEVLRSNDNYIWNEKLQRYINANAYLSIVATNNCQKECIYCINSHTDKSLELPYLKAIENIRKVVDDYNVKECVILGGEPLLYSNLFELVSNLKDMNFNKIVLTTNGIDLLKKTSVFGVMYKELFERGLTHLNISMHNERGFLDFSTLSYIYKSIKECYPFAKIRINTNVWKHNHDTLQSLMDWIDKFMDCSDSVRISNLIYKDSFSVNSLNSKGVSDIIMSDSEYNALFNSYIDYYSAFLTCIDNENALGFVDYTMIPRKSTVIINRNINSQVAKQVCENENTKINTFKCLVSGDISLSWNESNII